MKCIFFVALVTANCCYPLIAQQAPNTTEGPSNKVLTKQESALAHYYSDIKAYTLRYAPTPASCGDIADAAISACSESLNNYTKTVTELSVEDIKSIRNQLQLNARRWSAQLALEAKYPDPEIFLTLGDKKPLPIPSKPKMK